MVNYLRGLGDWRMTLAKPATRQFAQPTQGWLKECYRPKQWPSGLDCDPVHAQLPLAALAGDHDPAHAQRLVFRLGLHLPRRDSFVMNYARELRRRHRYWL
jgi:hypothetical protein